MTVPQRKKAKTPALETTASVQDLVNEAGRSIEVAAILRALTPELVARFHDARDGRPPFLLRRQGSGPRPAQVDSIVEAEGAIEKLAMQYEERARALLERRVELRGEEAPTPSTSIITDLVVSARP